MRVYGYAVTGVKFILIFIAFALLNGCGYTTGILLPAEYKTIYVENFANKVPITEEISDMRRYKTYHPLLEVEVTQAIIDRFIYDGHLRISKREDADIVLTGALVDFRREPTKYGYDDTIDQYRMAILVDMEAVDAKANKVMWSEKNFAGSDYYFTTGAQQKSESAAITDALKDLARRVVERTIEVW